MQKIYLLTFNRSIFALQMTHRNGNNLCDTAICIVFTKHFLQTTWWPQGAVCIVALAWIHITHWNSKIRIAIRIIFEKLFISVFLVIPLLPELLLILVRFLPKCSRVYPKKKIICQSKWKNYITLGFQFFLDLEQKKPSNVETLYLERAVQSSIDF